MTSDDGVESLKQLHERLPISAAHSELALALVAAVNSARGNPRAVRESLLRWPTSRSEGGKRRGGQSGSPRKTEVDIGRIGPFPLFEGTKALDSAVSDLEAAPPMGPVVISPGMSMAAYKLAHQLGKKGRVSHWHADDHASPLKRLARFGRWSGGWAEVVWTGSVLDSSSPDEAAAAIVETLVVDDHVPSRSSRVSLYDATFTKIGVAVCPHSRKGDICVIVLAREYKEDPVAQEAWFAEHPSGDFLRSAGSGGMPRSPSSSSVQSAHSEHGVASRRGKQSRNITFQVDTKAPPQDAEEEPRRDAGGGLKSALKRSPTPRKRKTRRVRKKKRGGGEGGRGGSAGRAATKRGKGKNKGSDSSTSSSDGSSEDSGSDSDSGDSDDSDSNSSGSGSSDSTGSDNDGSSSSDSS